MIKIPLMQPGLDCLADAVRIAPAVFPDEVCEKSIPICPAGLSAAFNCSMTWGRSSAKYEVAYLLGFRHTQLHVLPAAVR